MYGDYSRMYGDDIFFRNHTRMFEFIGEAQEMQI